jgi:uncharacterized protein YkwD
MSRLLRSAVLVAMGACAQIPVTTGSTLPGGATTATTSANAAADVVAATNDARARNGLPAFVVSAKLMEAARIQAEQMAAYRKADHVISGAQYPTPQSRLDAVGYTYTAAAENVAWNQPDARSAVAAWMNSAAHRANILDPSLKQIGAAMARSSSGEPYWVQVFGTPR